MPQGYNKFLVPPAVGGKSKLEVILTLKYKKIRSKQYKGDSP